MPLRDQEVAETRTELPKTKTEMTETKLAETRTELPKTKTELTETKLAETRTESTVRTLLKPKPAVWKPTL